MFITRYRRISSMSTRKIEKATSEQPALPSKRAEGQGWVMHKRKWGEAAWEADGFTVIPSLLLSGQERLGLSPTQINVLLQLIVHWHTEAAPYPSQKVIAARMGISRRQVMRILQELHDAGLIQKRARSDSTGAKRANAYDLSGLVKKLAEISPLFIAAKKLRQRAEKKGANQMAEALEKLLEMTP